LFVYINDFYAKNRTIKRDVGSLCPSYQVVKSSGAREWKEFGGPRTLNKDSSDYLGVPNLNEDFQDFIWNILRQEKDFIVGKNGEGNHLHLSEIINDIRSQMASDNYEVSKEEKRLEKEWRVYVSEERRWWTLTGHGVDQKKVFSFSPLSLFR
jgi:hypothetical protein